MRLNLMLRVVFFSVWLFGFFEGDFGTAGTFSVKYCELGVGFGVSFRIISNFFVFNFFFSNGISVCFRDVW